MTRFGQPWFDDEAGPLVRPYTVTGGRTHRAGQELDMLTVVVRGSPSTPLRRPEPEYPAILRLCRVPQSVAEVSAVLRLPLTVTKILVGDLIGDGHLRFRAPVRAEADTRDLTVLRAVLNGIRRL
ncbi:DUF742 domain-containing protein [Nocardia sp. alder85J]|uniref:DUF742 domain-containing protein n=1 Tax=Nocardia sp. alder85J TaxID=2862949 RepID=UPI001CD3933E|nr:DUF742 domain-containing protein [Nocardia sp. alder85J]MCX4098005.1 DUF742 domain-containing protein [Nocardia sp. alder85J]